MLVIKFSYKIVVLLLKLSMLAVKCVENKVRTTAGEEVDIKEVPYTVSTSTGCTGALIKPQWVLSAGHCFLNSKWKNMTIGLGTADWVNPQYNIKIEKAYVHPKYIATTLERVPYDIAVLKLALPMPPSESIQVLELEETDWPATDKKECTLAGFGRNIYNNTKLHISKYNFSRGCGCIQDKRIICISGRKDHHNTPCYGDSGGVVVCGDKGVVITSSLIPINFCNTRNTALFGKTLERCKHALPLFSYIKPNLQWLKNVLYWEPDTYLRSTASRLPKNSIQHYDVLTTSKQLFALLIIFSSYVC